jgi:prophage antirepressor-like protein
MTFIHGSAMYMLTFSAQKTESSIKFKEWVANVLTDFRNANLKSDVFINEIAADTSATIAQPLLKRLMELGIKRKEL